jgi:colanic acid/amylovoran biosynthesis glycosyltransferase
MQERVRFTGFVPLAELDAMARTHHLLMHPSVHAAGGDAEGGHPVVMTQAAATGMPILGTRHCDIPEVVEPGRTGWLVPERDVDALTAALLDVAARPDVLPAYGRAARALVEAKYDARRDTLDTVYDAVLARR